MATPEDLFPTLVTTMPFLKLNTLSLRLPPLACSLSSRNTPQKYLFLSRSPPVPSFPLLLAYPSRKRSPSKISPNPPRKSNPTLPESLSLSYAPL